MNIIIAEAIGFTKINGTELLHAKTINTDNPKHQMIMNLFTDPQISFFLNIGQRLTKYLGNDTPLVFVTDWTDPTEMIGLLLEDSNEKTPYPNLGFLAFPTDWDNLESSGIAQIFSHEFSHLWLHFIGFDFNLSQANTFHTITSVTDQYMAFSEGFAEHLEIVSSHVKPTKEKLEIYDNGLDINAWISYRDQALREHAVINNRFIYQTAVPSFDKYPRYVDLHLAHITSSAFTPEHLKNGSQMLSSEGVISSFFYHFYHDDFFKNQYHNDEFYHAFDLTKDDTDALTNHYLKILYVLSKISLTSETILIDFILAYAITFGNEAKQLFKLFLDITNYTTIHVAHKKHFEDLYMIGKLGDPTRFKEKLLQVRALKESLLASTIDDPSTLKNGLFTPFWTQSESTIKPVPWNDKEEPFFFDINTASHIDFMSLNGINMKEATILIKKRDEQNGFTSLDEFETFINTLR